MHTQIAALQNWFTRSGGTMNAAVEIQHDPSIGLFLRVRDGYYLPPGSEVLSIPTLLTLSALDLFNETQEWWPDALLSYWKESPEVLTRLFLMREYLKGEASFWATYIALLPQPKGSNTQFHTPLYYTKDERAWILGTNLDAAMKARVTKWQAELEVSLVILKEDRGEVGLASYSW